MIQQSSTAFCYIVIYIDDIIILGSFSSDIDKLIFSLNAQFSLKDLGKLSYFLGIEVSCPPTRGLFLSQPTYISEVLSWTQMMDAKSHATPMVSGSVVLAYQGDDFSDPYSY